MNWNWTLDEPMDPAWRRLTEFFESAWVGAGIPPWAKTRWLGCGRQVATFEAELREPNGNSRQPAVAGRARSSSLATTAQRRTLESFYSLLQENVINQQSREAREYLSMTFDI